MQYTDREIRWEVVLRHICAIIFSVRDQWCISTFFWGACLPNCLEIPVATHSWASCFSDEPGVNGCARTHARIPTVRVGSSRNQAFTRWEIVLREEGDLFVNARLYLRYGAFIVEECVRYTQKVLLTSYVAGVPFYHIRILLLRLQVFYL